LRSQRKTHQAVIRASSSSSVPCPGSSVRLDANDLLLLLVGLAGTHIVLAEVGLLLLQLLKVVLPLHPLLVIFLLLLLLLIRTMYSIPCILTAHVCW
jgi:hypothetical protein